jgi:hypothetical protein
VIGDARGRPVVRRGRSVLVAAIAICAIGWSASPAFAAGKLQITMTHVNAYGLLGFREPFARNSRTFARESTGNVYEINVTNVGDQAIEPTSPVVLSDELPAGILLDEPGDGESVVAGGSPPAWKCENVGAVHGGSFECELDQPYLEVFPSLAPGASYPPITAEVSVSAGAAPPVTDVTTLLNTPTVSGGGVESQPPSTSEAETTITPAVPFGIETSAIHIGEFSSAKVKPGEELEFDETDRIEELEKAFKPDTQAGGHPPSLVSSLLFNYTPDTVNGLGKAVPKEERAEGKGQVYLEPAGGNVKEAHVETPPGFVGDVVDKPRCPLFNLQKKGGHCPPDTAVGYTVVSLGGEAPAFHEETGRLKLFREPSEGSVFTREEGNDPDRSLVYNVQPAAGSPAEFAFEVTGGLTFELDVHVRTDGDYGITVGSSSAGGNFPAVDVTMCEYGAEGSEVLGYHCDKPGPGSKPFLTNPTKCEGPAPVWTATAAPWAEPTDEVSKPGHANAALEQSGSEVVEKPRKPGEEQPEFVTGCDQLQFKPAVELAPSAPAEGGTTQPDAPTAVTVHVKVPQAPDEENTPATPAVRDITTTLPEGMTASPSAADGLEACTNAEFGLGTEFGTPEHPLPPGVKPTEPANAASCPPASQIGTVETRTPLLTGAPAASGPEGGTHTVTCSEGRWTNAKPSLSYQWLRNGAPSPGEQLESEDLGAEAASVTAEKNGLSNAIQCQVTARSATGSSVAVSQPVYPESALPFPPANIPRPTGASEPKPGEALTCAAGSWNSTTAVGFSYQWLRNGEPIAGASSGSTTAATFPYTLTSEDAGKVIQCQITGINAAGTAVADSAGVIVTPVPANPPPLPGASLQGELFLGAPECSPCSNADAQDGKLFRLFLQMRDPRDGLIVRVVGHNEVNPLTGQIKSVFEDQPQQPFESLQLKLKGGPRAPIANPQACGPAKTEANLTPWSAGPGGPSGTEEGSSEAGDKAGSEFTVGAGEPCASPFAPSFNAGTVGPTATTADAYTDFSLNFGREDREQDLAGLTVHMPLGLVGKIAGVTQCGQAEIAAAINNTGECPAASEIGTATTLAGPGSDPFATTGHVYFTGPTTLQNGQKGPFGLAVVTLAKAGPFNLGNVVVRSAINIDPNTAAVNVTSDPLPQIISGVPIRLRQVKVNVTRPGFMLNPTNCSEQHVSVTLTSANGAAAPVSSPFGVTGCKNLAFKPTFTAVTQANSSKANGASLNVKITYPQGYYANIGKSVTELPTALPSRLTTLQKACPDAVFNVNPASCPEGAVVGQAIAHTPLLSQPLVGPAILVSHGGAKYPDLEILLQGEGVEVVLDGSTEITKGVTKTSFESVPDSPVDTFELNLPEGPHSVLGANGDLCTEPLNLPTTLTGQNGAVMKQITKIAVTGCPPTVAITKVKLSGNAVLVTVKLSAAGTVKIAGKGLTTIKKSLKAGTHQIRVPLTKKGRSLRSHHKKATLSVKLTVGKQAVAKSMSVKL